MFILEDPAATAALGSASALERFDRVDAGGSVWLCDDDPHLPARGVRPVDVLFTGGQYGPAGGDWLFYVGLWTPEDFREEFVAWYRHEHMPILLECDRWGGCRFVEEKVAHGCQFYALHQLWDKTALDSDERKRSRATPWFKRLAANDWFDGAFTRTLCVRPR